MTYEEYCATRESLVASVSAIRAGLNFSVSERYTEEELDGAHSSGELRAKLREAQGALAAFDADYFAALAAEQEAAEAAYEAAQ